MLRHSDSLSANCHSIQWLNRVAISLLLIHLADRYWIWKWVEMSKMTLFLIP